jgi:hypothetical protein
VINLQGHLDLAVLRLKQGEIVSGIGNVTSTYIILVVNILKMVN